METFKLGVKPCCSSLLLAVFGLLASLASIADAEIHYHQFVVCPQILRFLLSISLE